MPLALAGGLAASAVQAFDAGRANFTVEVAGETLDYEMMSVTCMPGEMLRLTVPLAGSRERFDFQVEDAEQPARVEDSPTWRWRAPREPGKRDIVIVRHATGKSLRVRVFILRPAAEIAAGRLNGYAIGAYPEKPLRGLDAYRPPRGFIEVTRANLDTMVSPHFRLRQFLCKQAGDYPKYVLADTKLLRCLERVLERLNAAGKKSDTLFVMSGFRTPVYNASLGDTKNSRHQWGDAADVYPDQNGDGVIDDLDRDGRSTDRDSDFLYRFIDRLADDPEFLVCNGGLGLYGTTRTHPAFVHVDTRGYRARWKE